MLPKHPTSALLKNTSDNFIKFCQQQILPNFPDYSELKFSKQTPSHFQYQQILFKAIVNKLFLETNPQERMSVTKKLLDVVNKHKQNIIKLAEFKPAELEVCLEIMKKYLREFQRCKINKPELYFSFIGVLILSICEKKIEKILFIKTQATYTSDDYNKLSQQFGYPIIFLDYEKKMTKQIIQVYNYNICIFKMKQAYYYLYCIKKDLKDIKVISEIQPIRQSKIQRIFNAQRPKSSITDNQAEKTNEKNDIANSHKSSLQKTNNQKPTKSSYFDQTQNYEEKPKNQASTLKPSGLQVGQLQHKSYFTQTILEPVKIKCSICGREEKQYDCINWNYEYFCGNCLINPLVDTSHIPSQNIAKYCRVRKLNYKSYEIICPECSGTSTIKNYDVTDKPKYYRCNTCQKFICLQHNNNIFNCFCYCTQCHKVTIYINRMQVNFCVSCKTRYCFNCNKMGQKFCQCICSQCLGHNSPNHQCVHQCHRCHNSQIKLRECLCGLWICYGCFYLGLTNSKDGNLSCQIDEYC